VQLTHRRSIRIAAGFAHRPGSVPSMLLLAAATLLLAGCENNDDLMSTLAPGTSKPAPPGLLGQADARVTTTLLAPPDSDGAPNALTETARQRSYLAALTVAGLRPSTDLRALSIGSYVCQALAAKQSDGAVWDFVLPLVRGDVPEGSPQDSAALGVGTRTVAGIAGSWPQAVVSPRTGGFDLDVDASTAAYIRIATEQLC
jgi:hypothetical protein